MENRREGEEQKGNKGGRGQVSFEANEGKSKKCCISSPLFSGSSFPQILYLSLNNKSTHVIQ
jgi:hypothetical protein